MFFHLYPESYTTTFFPDLTMPEYPHKASYFEYRLCHKIFSGKDRARIIEINCTDNNYFLCDRVCTQCRKLEEAILVVFDWENVGWKMMYYFLGIDEKTQKNLLTVNQNIRKVYSNIQTSVQCIQTKTT